MVRKLLSYKCQKSFESIRDITNIFNFANIKSYSGNYAHETILNAAQFLDLE